ncbi:threonylcarbamoyl-AMP synthase [Opitutaceae bacterium EW11]|nr:threonylcarbamoyl-AMP synthase [Opitutaceae bacterium EW11]
MPKLRATVHRGTPRAIALLARALQRGELVAVPTETVYGLAADALNPRACRSIFRAKGRPTNDPLIVHVHSLAQLDQLAIRNEAAAAVAKAFWPGPLTLVLPKRSCVPDIVTSGLDSVAIRMPAHPLLRKLLRACDRPLAAPSANAFGYISPTTAEHVLDGLGNRIRHILDGGPCRIGLESTILDLRDPKHPKILRPGAIERPELERVLGRRVSLVSRHLTSAKKAAIAPGMLTKHYSPRTPLELHAKLRVPRSTAPHADEAFVFLCPPSALRKTKAPAANVFVLSKTGTLDDAAHSLFATLRRLDRGKWTRIHAELARGQSALAIAINDRLTRAAAKR